MRRLVPTILAVVCLLGLIRLFRVAQHYDPSVERSRTAEGGLGDISIRLERATIISRASGTPEWALQTDRIDLLRGQSEDLEAYRQVEFAGVRNGVLYRDGRAESHFSAARAVYDRLAHRFDISGAIRLQTEKGDRIEADSCIWSQKDEFLRLPRGARGVFRSQRVSAPLMLYLPKKHLVQCPQGAEATFQGYPLRASQLFWDLDKEEVWCPGTVSGRRRNLRFTTTGVRLNLLTHDMQSNAGRATIRIEGDDGEFGGFE